MLAGIDAIGGFVIGGATGGSFTVSVSPTEVSKSAGTRGASKTLTTAPVTVTAAGGSGGYSYAWARTSGAAAITAGTPTGAVTTFSATLNPDDTFTATFVCTVTDASGAILHTEAVTVTLTLTFIDIGGSL